MIISNLLGGLGNQMFQYAAARALSLARGQPLRLDISGFADYRLHQGFELQRVFNCSTDIANAAEVRSILGWQSVPLIRRVLARPALAAFRRAAFIVEPHFHHWPEIMDVPQDCYLLGYWQSEKYFQNVESVIREDFAFKPALVNRNMELAEQISQVNAVSLHVRRGDYAQDPKTNVTHGLCSLDYYRAAIQHIAAKVEQPHFFIFSDDMDWVKAQLKIDLPCHYVDHNHGAESYNDMRLMSLCRHHIIANSSFSWWGAWLNTYPDKIVVSPRRWFASANITKDLFPHGWLALL